MTVSDVDLGLSTADRFFLPHICCIFYLVVSLVLEHSCTSNPLSYHVTVLLILLDFPPAEAVHHFFEGDHDRRHIGGCLFAIHLFHLDPFLQPYRQSNFESTMELTFVTELGEPFVVEIDENMELENVMVLLEAKVSSVHICALAFDVVDNHRPCTLR